MRDYGSASYGTRDTWLVGMYLYTYIPVHVYLYTQLHTQ
jgi:hypothetical protein